MITSKQIKFINATTSDWHDDVASINEEFVDEDEKEVLRLCKELIRKLSDFKDNLKSIQ